MQTPGRAHSHWVSCACAYALPYGRASETRQAPGNRISGRLRQLGNNDSKTVYELAEIALNPQERRRFEPVP